MPSPDTLPVDADDLRADAELELFGDAFGFDLTDADHSNFRDRETE